MEILTSLEAADSDSVKKIFIDFVKEYLTPSYGSMSKRDFEILLFMKLQELEAIDKDPDLYRLIKELKISRSRARNLLYEAKMRSTEDKDLNEELIKLLQKPIFLKDGDTLVDKIVSTKAKENTIDLFIKEGIMVDNSFKAIFAGVIKKLGQKFAGKAGELATENAFKYLSPIITGTVETIKEEILQLFNNGKEELK